MTRAQRRHQVNRIKDKRRKYWEAQPYTARSIGKTLYTPKRCNCWMCSKPRLVEGMNMQERRARLRYTD